MSTQSYNEPSCTDATKERNQGDNSSGKQSPCPSGTQAPGKVKLSPQTRALLSVGSSPNPSSLVRIGTSRSVRTPEEIARQRHRARSRRRSEHFGDPWRGAFGAFVAQECGVRYVREESLYDPKRAEKILPSRTPLTEDNITSYRKEAIRDLGNGNLIPVVSSCRIEQKEGPLWQ